MFEADTGGPCLNGSERRNGVERRTHNLITLVHALHGRRSLGRRSGDQAKLFFDRHEPQFLFVTLSIFILCGIDALFTMSLIEAGVAVEANPVMRWLMEEGYHVFWIGKLSITALSLLVLLPLKNVYFIRRIRVSYLLYGALIMYLLLIRYELWLFSFI